MKPLHIISLVLVIIGALNWGLVGFFGFDLVAWIFGGQLEPWSRIVYGLVGIAGLVIIFTASVYGSRGAYSAHRVAHTEHPAEHPRAT